MELTSRSLTDDGLGVVAELTSLTHLDLYKCDEVTDLGIVWLARGCPNLIRLDICFCYKVTDAGIDRLVAGCRNCFVATSTSSRHLNK